MKNKLTMPALVPLTAAPLFCPVHGRCVDGSSAGVFQICAYCPVVACRNHGRAAESATAR